MRSGYGQQTPTRAFSLYAPLGLPQRTSSRKTRGCSGDLIKIIPSQHCQAGPEVRGAGAPDPEYVQVIHPGSVRWAKGAERGGGASLSLVHWRRPNITLSKCPTCQLTQHLLGLGRLLSPLFPSPFLSFT